MARIFQDQGSVWDSEFGQSGGESHQSGLFRQKVKTRVGIVGGGVAGHGLFCHVLRSSLSVSFFCRRECSNNEPLNMDAVEVQRATTAKTSLRAPIDAVSSPEVKVVF